VSLVAHELGADGDEVGRRHGGQAGDRQNLEDHSCQLKGEILFTKVDVVVYSPSL